MRLVHTFHGHTFHSYFSPLKTLFFIQIEKILARFTDKIIVLSRQQKNDICSTYQIAVREKVRIVPLGFDLSGFADIESSPKTSIEKNTSRQNSNPLRVGIIGRLTSVKNHFMVLEAIKCLKLAGKIDNFKFIVIGDGELKKEFVEKACELDLMNAIVLKGWQEDMPAVYARLDAVALTSKNEGTPVALIEAMAACRPVVAAAVGGVPDLLGSVLEQKPAGFQIAERGLMVQSGDAAALARALLYLSETRCAMQPMVRKAKGFVLNYYDQGRLLKDIKMLYGELLEQ